MTMPSKHAAKTCLTFSARRQEMAGFIKKIFSFENSSFPSSQRSIVIGRLMLSAAQHYHWTNCCQLNNVSKPSSIFSRPPPFRHHLVVHTHHTHKYRTIKAQNVTSIHPTRHTLPRRHTNRSRCPSSSMDQRSLRLGRRISYWNDWPSRLADVTTTLCSKSCFYSRKINRKDKCNHHSFQKTNNFHTLQTTQATTTSYQEYIPPFVPRWRGTGLICTK